MPTWIAATVMMIILATLLSPLPSWADNWDWFGTIRAHGTAASHRNSRGPNHDPRTRSCPRLHLSPAVMRFDPRVRGLARVCEHDLSRQSRQLA